MKSSILAYTIGMILVLVGERIIDEGTTLHYLTSGIGCVCLLTAIGFTVKPPQNIREDQKKAFRLPLIFTVLGFLSVVCFLMSSDPAVQMLGLEEDGARKWSVVTQVLAGILWLASALPLFALYSLFSSGIKHINDRRANQRTLQWLGTAFAIASLFPINYIANDMNIKWDCGYFKTAMPGESSQSIVGNFADPITAYLFFKNGNQVTEEVHAYFSELNGNNFSVVKVDHAAEPELAKDLSIRNNGYIALVKGKDDARQIERIKIGEDFSTARRTLKKLDEKVREGFLKVAKDTDVIYFTTGHGEMYWKVDEEDDQGKKVSFLKRILRSANFSTKELNISNGLANEIPEDAKVVMMLSPLSELTEAETDTLFRFWENGGALFITLEPQGATLKPLLNKLGLDYNPVPLGHNQSRMPTKAKAAPTDSRNLITNKYSTHPSVTNLSRFNKLYFLVFPETGSLSKIEGAKTKTKEVIKTPDKTWPDKNGNYSQDTDEDGAVWNLAVAVEQDITVEEQEKQSRGIVFADSTWLNDQYLGRGYNAEGQVIRPHAMALANTLFWLAEQEEIAGEVSNENDIKIQHTKKGQSWIFFSTIVFIPMGFFGVGMIRIRRRKIKGEQ